jgi:hypothetical protein
VTGGREIEGAKLKNKQENDWKCGKDRKRDSDWMIGIQNKIISVEQTTR